MTATTTSKARNEFSLTAFSDEIVKDMVRIARRGTHVRRGMRAISRQITRVLVDGQGWGKTDALQFWRNCKDIADLERTEQ